MKKILWVAMFIVPMIESIAVWLETIDADTDGLDDQAAKALRVAAAAIKELAK